MKKPIGLLLMLLVSAVLKGLKTHPENHLELARLKMSLMYIHSIRTFRLLFLSLLGMGVCLIFLLAGLILAHVSIFLYASWSPGVKMLAGLSCAVVYILLAIGLFNRIFASDMWLKIFHAQAITDRLHEEEAPSEDRTKSNRGNGKHERPHRSFLKKS